MWGRASVIAWLVACGGGTVGDDTPGDDDSPTDGNHNTPVDVPGGVGEPANLTGITLAHNQIRAAVQTQAPLPFLTWSPSLAATAAAWVAQCQSANGQLLDHNDGRSSGHPYYVGENIYASSGQASGDDAVQLWASEGANYNYANNSCSGGTCGHYTQLVWRATLEVGCALGNCNGLQFPSTIVCDYGPGGNVGGQKPY